MSLTRQVINSKLKEVFNEKAVLTTFNEIDLTLTNSLLNSFSKEYEKLHKIDINLLLKDFDKLPLTALFVFAMTQAVKTYPIINALIDSSVKNIIYRDYVDMIVPLSIKANDTTVNVVVRDCQSKSFTEILKELITLKEKANKNQLSIEDIQQGTISINISNESLLGLNTLEDNTNLS